MYKIFLASNNSADLHPPPVMTDDLEAVVDDDKVTGQDKTDNSRHVKNLGNLLED